PISRSIKAYQGLVHTLSNKVSNGDHKMLFSVNWLEDNRLDFHRPKLQSSKHETLFEINVHIAVIDHILVVSPEMLKSLIIAKQTINERIELNTEYKSMLIEKCEYLIRKINYRFKEDKKNYVYAFNFEDSKVEPSGKLDYFESLHAETLTHYQT